MLTNNYIILVCMYYTINKIGKGYPTPQEKAAEHATEKHGLIMSHGGCLSLAADHYKTIIKSLWFYAYKHIL